MEHISIRMFGEFSLQAGEVQISDRSSRSKKVWILLAYLLNHRKQIISKKELIQLLWNEDASSDKPENALKITLHRARTLLNQLWPQAGHDLILCKKGGYTWNTDIPLYIDAEEYEILCQKKTADTQERIENLLCAIAMYRGEFLGSLSDEIWVAPLTAYYHNQYMQAVLEVVPLLASAGRHEEVVSICREALVQEAYHEPLHQYLMKAMLAQGDYKGTAAVYEKLSRQMFEELGIKPGKETVELYRIALQTISKQSLPMEEILLYLQENHVEGAMECDYDYFKILSYAEARASRRNNTKTHIALLSLKETFDNKEISRKSQERIMRNLGQQICITLRQSDTFAQCSPNQYILMLPETDYENSCKVCQRILKNYYRKYPHVSVEVCVEVKLLHGEGMM